jgi:hypothetical protein
VMYFACLVCGIILTFFWLDWAELWKTISSNACHTTLEFLFNISWIKFFYIWMLLAHYVTIKIALI